ncbi:unnamed protein product, partial [Laminaria digitata]
MDGALPPLPCAPPPRRIRVVFSAATGCIPRSNPTLYQRWILIPSKLEIIGGLTNHLARQIKVPKGSKAGHSLVLTLDGFVLPPTESLDVLRDTDVVTLELQGGCDSRTAVDDGQQRIPGSTSRRNSDARSVQGGVAGGSSGRARKKKAAAAAAAAVAVDQQDKAAAAGPSQDADAGAVTAVRGKKGGKKR